MPIALFLIRNWCVSPLSATKTEILNPSVRCSHSDFRSPSLPAWFVFLSLSQFRCLFFLSNPVKIPDFLFKRSKLLILLFAGMALGACPASSIQLPVLPVCSGSGWPRAAGTSGMGACGQHGPAWAAPAWRTKPLCPCFVHEALSGKAALGARRGAGVSCPIGVQ